MWLRPLWSGICVPPPPSPSWSLGGDGGGGGGGSELMDRDCFINPEFTEMLNLTSFRDMFQAFFMKWELSLDCPVYNRNVVCKILSRMVQLAEEVMTEDHNGQFTVHPGATNMYQDLRINFWWPGMKKDIVEFVSKCLVCQKVKIEHQKPSVRVDLSAERLARLYVKEIVRLHGVLERIVNDRDLKFTFRFWGVLQEALGTQLRPSTAYHPQEDASSGFKPRSN
ncbi:uncharacterized protein LOC133313011 [Gastrolobium bilobum]|uniref:uncharacterized protein LOC133313011 n=1 Tax=Gastrolobium bilobum TaxID=150636 RepID=UPI002AB09177|nr:uncharacterized protein LOC133313011 [Gastrolobium bilobum]